MIDPPRARPRREVVRPDAASSLAVEVQRVAGWPFNWHQHAECELTLIRAGRGLRLVGDAVERFGPGDLALLGPGLPHTWVSDRGCGPCRAVVVKFPATLAAAGLAGSAEQEGLRPLLARARCGLVFTGKARDAAQRELEALAAATAPLARLGRLHLALAILAEGRGRTLAAAPPAPAIGDGRLGKVLALIHARADEALPAAQAAACAGLHPAAFSRWFRRALGVGFVRYLAEVRIALACRHLAEGGQDITAIAFACGFGSLSGFNRWFRRVRGDEPRRWRALARGTV